MRLFRWRCRSATPSRSLDTAGRDPATPVVQDELIQLLAGRRGHFQMESGYHSEQWFRLDSLFEDESRLQPFVIELARRLAVHRVKAVCGPATGGAKLARMIAGELGLPGFFTERFERPEAGDLFPVGYALPADQIEQVQGLDIAIVDDAISAGSAVRGTYAELVDCRARPVALGALFVFGTAAAEFAGKHGLALEGIVPMSFAMWLPATCPLCRAGVPLEKVSDTA